MTNSKYDLNRYKKVYPLVRNKPVYDELLMLGGLDTETVIIEFNNSNEESYTFTKNYNEIPTVAVTPEDENVNIYIVSLSTTSLTLESSSAFTGKAHVQIFKSEN